MGDCIIFRGWLFLQGAFSKLQQNMTTVTPVSVTSHATLFYIIYWITMIISFFWPQTLKKYHRLLKYLQ